MGKIGGFLRMLRDVEGVQGSFVIAGSGALVEQDLPAIFDGELLGEVGPRIARLYETFLTAGGDMETCVLRFAEHKLYVRRMTGGILAIVSAVGVNLPALRMVVNLVIRRIDPEIRAAAAAPARVTPPPLPAAASVEAAPTMASASSSLPPLLPLLPVLEDGSDLEAPSSGRRVRMYRGRPVDS